MFWKVRELKETVFSQASCSWDNSEFLSCVTGSLAFWNSSALPLTDASTSSGQDITHSFISQRCIKLCCVPGLASESVSAQALPFDAGTQAGKSIKMRDVKSYRRGRVREKGHSMPEQPGQSLGEV